MMCDSRIKGWCNDGLGLNSTAPHMDTTAISPRRFLSIACTIVGCGLGGSTSMLAHVILVDYHGNTVFDNHVAPTMFISDYRTSVTGLLPMHLDGAPEFTKVQRDVADKIHGKVLVGHAIWNDLSGRSQSICSCIYYAV